MPRLRKNRAGRKRVTRRALYEINTVLAGDLNELLGCESVYDPEYERHFENNLWAPDPPNHPTSPPTTLHSDEHSGSSVATCDEESSKGK